MNVIGFDDAPFERTHRGNVLLVGIVCSRTRVDGILVDAIRRDGANSTATMAKMLRRSQFLDHVRAVFLQGIAVGGFNVVDMHALNTELGIPVIAVARKLPDWPRMQKALFARVGNAEKKWKLIEKAGPMESVRGIYIQRAGVSLERAREILAATTLHGNLPEPLRVAHLMAGAMVTGISKGGA